MSKETQKMRKRPEIFVLGCLTLWALGLLLIVGGLFRLAGYSFLLVGTPTAPRSILFIVTGISAALTGTGIWRMKKWSAILLMLFFGLFKLDNFIMPGGSPHPLWSEIFQVIFMFGISVVIWRNIEKFDTE
jgi:hypothetical protein